MLAFCCHRNLVCMYDSKNNICYFLSFSLWNLSLIAILRLTFKRSNFGPKFYYMIQNRKMTQGIVFGRFVGSRAVTGVRWLSVLWETDNCWICWERAIRMHQIPNWEVEDVLKEKEGLTNVSCSVQFTWARSRQCIDKIWILMFFLFSLDHDGIIFIGTYFI